MKTNFYSKTIKIKYCQTDGLNLERTFLLIQPTMPALQGARNNLSQSTIGAPAQHNQSSRKGKKAWRKHVDIEDLETGLEELRAEERVTGYDLILVVQRHDINGCPLAAVSCSGKRYRRQRMMNYSLLTLSVMKKVRFTSFHRERILHELF